MNDTMKTTNRESAMLAVCAGLVAKLETAGLGLAKFTEQLDRADAVVRKGARVVLRAHVEYLHRVSGILLEVLDKP